MANVVTSTQGQLNWRDILRGFVMAVIGSILGTLTTVTDAGGFDLDWKRAAIGAFVAGLSYILNNLKDPSKVIITGVPKESVEAVKNEVLQKVVNNSATLSR